LSFKLKCLKCQYQIDLKESWGDKVFEGKSNKILGIYFNGFKKWTTKLVAFIFALSDVFRVTENSK